MSNKLEVDKQYRKDCLITRIKYIKSLGNDKIIITAIIEDTKKEIEMTYEESENNSSFMELASCFGRGRVEFIMKTEDKADIVSITPYCLRDNIKLVGKIVNKNNIIGYKINCNDYLINIDKTTLINIIKLGGKKLENLELGLFGIKELNGFKLKNLEEVKDDWFISRKGENKK